MMNQFEIDNDSASFEPVNLNLSGNITPSFQNDDTFGQQVQQQRASSNPNLATNNANGSSSSSWFQRVTSCFTISALEKHFNIDTIDFRNRIISAVLDANKPNHFREQVLYSNGGSKQPDLYGPVWITMTLVFFLAVTGNTAKYLKNDARDVEYDIGHLTKAFSILMFYTFVLPSAMFVMLQCVNVSTGLVELISIYGYSLVPFIPATILCLVPSVLLEWIFLLVATILSLLLVLRNIVHPAVSTRWAGPIALCIVVCHFIFYLVLKIVFYRHRGGNHNYNNNQGGADMGDDGISADDKIPGFLF